MSNCGHRHDIGCRRTARALTESNSRSGRSSVGEFIPAKGSIFLTIGLLAWIFRGLAGSFSDSAWCSASLHHVRLTRSERLSTSAMSARLLPTPPQSEFRPWKSRQTRLPDPACSRCCRMRRLPYGWLKARGFRRSSRPTHRNGGKAGGRLRRVPCPFRIRRCRRACPRAPPDGRPVLFDRPKPPWSDPQRPPGRTSDDRPC